jgi:hypothetical protein
MFLRPYKFHMMLVAVAVFALLPLSASAQQWLKTYDPSLNTLPDMQGWSFFEPFNPPAPSVSGGTLFQGPTGSQDQFWDATDIVNDFLNGPTFILEAQLKVIHSGYGFLADGSWRTGYDIYAADKTGKLFVIGIADTGVRMSARDNRDSSPFVSFDTTSAFNTYRLTVSNGIANLYINGNQIISLSADSIPYEIPNLVLFGGGGTGGGSQTQLKFLRYNLSQATPEPGVLSLLAGLAVSGVGFGFRHRRR